VLSGVLDHGHHQVRDGEMQIGFRDFLGQSLRRPSGTLLTQGHLKLCQEDSQRPLQGWFKYSTVQVPPAADLSIICGILVLQEHRMQGLWSYGCFFH
jgi:hypothetical protein